MTPESFEMMSGAAVSRETLDNLAAYEGLVRLWTNSINLVAKSQADDIWHRHIVDSAQIFPLIPQRATHLVDLGSGGGFPGIVIAILAKDQRPGLYVSLIESDRRKAAFLRTAAREFGLDVTVHAARIEEVEPQGADVVTSRALAPLDRLVPLAIRHLKPGGKMLLLKGANWKAELESVTTPVSAWTTPSRTSPDAVVVEIDLNVE